MDADVIVVGAGPAGLAVAACLRGRGINPLILDRGDGVGASWAGRYDRLHLHTPRVQSALPGLRMPRRFGRWVAKDDMAHYLRVYARRHELSPKFRTEVTRIERRGTGWEVSTDAGPLTARHVVVATGLAHTPVAPAFPGTAGFPGPVVHASAYRNAQPYRGLAVLVVGAGNSGAEIAADLAEQGAASVHLAIRTPPNLIPRQVGPVPTTLLAIPMDVLPSRVVDPLNRALQRAVLGDLTLFGMPAPRAGVVAQARATGVTPTIDVGLVAALQAGRVTPVAALDGFDGPHAVLVDGTRLAPDAVIMASGYATGLEGILADAGVLDGHGIPLVRGAQTLPSAPGLRFVGLFNPLKGQLLQIGLDARSIARAVAREVACR